MKNTASCTKVLMLCLLITAPMAVLAGFTGLEGRASLDYYLPDAMAYDPTIPVPSAVIGHEVGEQHVSHDRLVQYMKALARASNRVSLQLTGRTYEGRELLLLAISAPQNIEQLGAVQQTHMARVKAGQPGSGPIVVALGYSVHGNEASGSNAAMLVAYHLAAGESSEVLDLLANTIVLIDPSLNPDGMSRFAQWVNSHKGRVAIADSASREHNEVWPGGRTNHYWFDLNRDWLPAQHPESRARLDWFHQWRPHVLADFHEMGTDRSFFFQPGVASRTNPLTPAENIALTAELARFHAAAMDEKNLLYFSQENYDDFYYGKGSTYPDIHGSIGILFEQASARGHIQDSVNGRLGFPYAIRNQFITSLSTLRGAHALRDRLAANLNGFNARAVAEARKQPIGGYLFASPADAATTREFLDVLAIHQVEVYSASQPAEIGGTRYPAEQVFVVPLAQPQYRMVRTLFEAPTSFRDNTFYDVSAWTLPMAFGLPFRTATKREAGTLRSGQGVGPVIPAGSNVAEDAYAWILDWRHFYAARALNRVLTAGGQARVATREFTLDGKRFHPGSVVIPASLVADGRLAAVTGALRQAVNEGVPVTSVATGLTEAGIDLGSPSLEPVRTPRVALVVGEGVNPYEAGEVWHLLDQRFELPVTHLELSQLGRVRLDAYSHLVVVDGRYDQIPESIAAAMADWVRAGGILVAQRRGASWALESGKFASAEVQKEDSETSEKSDAQGDRPQQRAYAERDDWEASKVIGGAIFESRIDTSHPLGFGFPTQTVPVFHRGTDWVEASKNPFENVAIYTEKPLLAGFASPDNVAALVASVAVRQSRVGQGSIILFSDIPAFRAFWLGTSRLWLNALYFGKVVEAVKP